MVKVLDVVELEMVLDVLVRALTPHKYYLGVNDGTEFFKKSSIWL